MNCILENTRTSGILVPRVFTDSSVGGKRSAHPKRIIKITAKRVVVRSEIYSFAGMRLNVMWG